MCVNNWKNAQVFYTTHSCCLIHEAADFWYPLFPVYGSSDQPIVFPEEPEPWEFCVWMDMWPRLRDSRFRTGYRIPGFEGVLPFLFFSNIFIIIKHFSLDQCGSVGRASSHKARGRPLDAWSEHMPG